MSGRTIFLAVVSFVAAGCAGNDAGTEAKYPEIELSHETVNFGDVGWGEPVTRDIVLRNRGELDMGVVEIALMQDGLEHNFLVQYDFSEVLCTASNTTGEARAAAKGKKGADDTGEGFYDTADTAASAAAAQVLPAGCEVPIHVTFDPRTIGKVYAGLRITTFDEPTESADPSYFRDPDEEFKVVLLQGIGLKDDGKILVNPRVVDFGIVWADVTALEYVSIGNIGDGPLTLEDYEFTSACQGLVSVTWGYDPAKGQVLEPAFSTVLELAYTPSLSDADDKLECDLRLHSDDPNEPQVAVRLKANVQGTAADLEPQLQLIGPSPGHVVSGPPQIEIDMFDVNQPADSLQCKIRSERLQSTKIADCAALDKSGHVTAVVAITDLDDGGPGTDTISVTVTDISGQTAYATTTFLYLANYPVDDMDRDGYSPTDKQATDCDDTNINTYPFAAELPDDGDNDCDGTIDEGTINFDDDGDGEAEVDGDCDDRNDATHPGAIEIPDNGDNDCDGIIDEDTSAFDDDGDGFNEINLDCDDDDSTINPAAEEYCDRIDNDCDGFTDAADGCIETDSQPIIVGGIRPEKTDIVVGESVTLSVLGYDADGQDLSYTWDEDNAIFEQGEHTAIDNLFGPIVTFKAPDTVTNDLEEYSYELQIQINDADKNRDWAFGTITVHAEPIDQTRTIGGDEGCSNNGDEALLVPVLPLLLVAWSRRRRPVA
jgi:hypothetical protein